MKESWEKARSKYDWTVDLRDFKHKDNYEGYFNEVIDNENTLSFENKFKLSLESEQTFVTAGEVCFWKNYGSHLSRDKLTNSLLKLLAQDKKWETYVYSLVELATTPTFENIDSFRKACGQPNGFATPVTFRSFYNPNAYPMVDKIIGFWWNAHKAEYWKSNAPNFLQRDGDGWLGLNEQNWNAYLEWTNFCREYSTLLNWRARDVEMAVWEAQKRKVPLSCLL